MWVAGAALCLAVGGCSPAVDKTSTVQSHSCASHATEAPSQAPPTRPGRDFEPLTKQQHSVPWKLERIREGGCVLVISYGNECDAPSRVQIREGRTDVLIRAVILRSTGELCASSRQRFVLLPAPLGDRHLVHARVAPSFNNQ